MQFAEFLHLHFHLISGWIGGRIKSGYWYMLLRIFSGSRCKSPWGSEAKCTWCGWLCDAHVASSASSFSKCDLPMTRISCEFPEACANAAPHLAFTIPSNILNASLWSSSMHVVEGTGISGILLYCFWTFSRIACCFSSRVDRHLMSSDWDLISSACSRCKWDRTNTWVW